MKAISVTFTPFLRAPVALTLNNTTSQYLHVYNLQNTYTCPIKKTTNFTNLCIFILTIIGQQIGMLNAFATSLIKFLRSKNITFIKATASDNINLQYLAPYTACTTANLLKYSGTKTGLFFDDLSKHAIAYRQISLLLKRAPGREAYPGDIFFLHSRLLENALKLHTRFLGTGSLTLIPLIEIQLNDISSYIPTNVISITDGQIFLDTILFNFGKRPAINTGLSVSRVGSNAQILNIKHITAFIKYKLTNYKHALTSYNASIHKLLVKGLIITIILETQSKFKYMHYVLQISIINILLYLNYNVIKFLLTIAVYICFTTY